tara:strand:+ start:602 stop:805 length:204 start_codon:yes stop_codon:yes gene_type:complete
MQGLLDLEAAAEFLSASKRQVRRWVHTRRIPYVRIDRRLRFRPEEVEAFVRSHAQESIPPLPPDDGT